MKIIDPGNSRVLIGPGQGNYVTEDLTPAQDEFRTRLADSSGEERKRFANLFPAYFKDVPLRECIAGYQQLIKDSDPGVRTVAAQQAAHIVVALFMFKKKAGAMVYKEIFDILSSSNDPVIQEIGRQKFKLGMTYLKEQSEAGDQSAIKIYNDSAGGPFPLNYLASPPVSGNPVRRTTTYRLARGLRHNQQFYRLTRPRLSPNI